MILALIEYDKKGSPVVVKTYLKTTHEQWIKQCSIADEAIQFQAKYTELERFNSLHTNLLLTNLIKQGVLRKEGVELDPIIRDKIKVEVARNAWHFSRKKKLMQEFEYQYEKSSGKFKEQLWRRVWSGFFEKMWELFGRLIPQPVKDLFSNLKEKFKT